MASQRHPLCLLGHGPAPSMSAGWGPLSMRVSFSGVVVDPGSGRGRLWRVPQWTQRWLLQLIGAQGALPMSPRGD